MTLRPRTWPRAVGAFVFVFVFSSLAIVLGEVLARQPAVAASVLALPVDVSSLPARSGVDAAGSGGADVALGEWVEPAIAVNPADAANIAEADLFNLRVSTDSGASWSAATAEVGMPGSHIACGDSSLAFDGAGRLFWTYLACLEPDYRFVDIFVAEVDPATGAILSGYPVNVTASAGVPASGSYCHDKPWLAADHFMGSPFQDRLYVVWTQFSAANCSGPIALRTAYSSDHGQTWLLSLTLSDSAEGYVLPAHNAVAANGDVYVAYHSQPGYYALDGVTGRVFVVRSVDGGASYPQKTLAYAPGNADITYNIQSSARTLAGSRTYTLGSLQPWVVPDPASANVVSVVVSDDPTNTAQGGANDDTAVYIVRSTDSGATWGAQTQVDSGPGTSHQIFPTAAIDPVTQCLTVQWYDTRAGATNANGDYLLDVYMRSSADGGLTFGHEVKINDAAFDPDFGAVPLLPPTTTLRIGEYIGVAVYNRLAHAVWMGNTATGLQIIYDKNAVCQPDTDGDGCPDASEQQTAAGSEASGGRRDYLNPWDYFNPTQDGMNRTDDLTAVVLHYGHDDNGDPLYGTRYDRRPLAGGHPWQFGPPDGVIRSFDITAAVRSYGHDCA
jgi:hypothetical protein